VKRRLFRPPPKDAPLPHPSWSGEESPRPAPGERKRLMLRFWETADPD
jgi:hypothetical protein